MDDMSLEFAAAYKSVYKDKFNNNAESYFNSLVEKAGVNAEENRRTAEEYRVAQKAADDLKTLSGKKKGLRTFLIVLAVVLLIVAAVCVLTMDSQSSLFALYIVGIIVGVLGFVAIIVVIVKVLNPKIKNTDAEQAKKAKEAADLKSKCLAQLQPLFNLFDNYSTFLLIEKTVPLFKFDTNFNMKRYDYFRGKYGYGHMASTTNSTLDVFSGEIKGNPFFLQKELEMEMGQETYHGTLLITWTETRRDSQGHTQRVTRSQTLHASVVKPKPFYSQFTRLVYANDGAPDLSFSRKPSYADEMSAKQLDRKLKAGEKQIHKLAAKSVKTGGNFTEMGNSDFDVLFGALDRDNEVQFRLLFTPLAQKNMLELIKNPDPFGDDFVFIKEKCVNFIASEHSQKFDYVIDPDRFVSYDIDICKSQFLDYNNSFFKNLYFEFAPLMCIPLYQQHKPTEYIYQHEYESNNTMYEAEVLANRLDVSLLCHPKTKTDVILSATISQKNKDEDVVEVNAYSFDTENMTDFVPVFGGDGRMHNVPVHWLNYIPLENKSYISISTLPEKQTNQRDQRNGDSATRHGLIAKFIQKQK